MSSKSPNKQSRFRNWELYFGVFGALAGVLLVAGTVVASILGYPGGFYAFLSADGHFNEKVARLVFSEWRIIPVGTGFALMAAGALCVVDAYRSKGEK